MYILFIGAREDEQALDHLLQTAIALEVLFVNLLTTHFSSKRKYSNVKIIATQSIFTIIVFYGMWLILQLGTYPKIIFIIIGFIYFFPIRYLYNEKPSSILKIMFFSWTHTIIVNSFSVGIAKILDSPNRYADILIIQTIIYLITTFMVIRFIRDKFIIVLKNIPTETNISLISFGMILFVTVTLLRFYFTVYANPYWTLIIIVLIAMIAITCYRLIYIIVDNTKRIDSLRQIAYSDYLTGVNNRLALFLDAEELILNRKPFYILYMDLDNFKNINDTYGHDIGDKYLKSFTKTTLEVIQDNGNFYRMSGDEFICIYYGSNIDIFIETFEEKIFNNFDTDISFLGVSIGYAKYPDDCETIDQLIKKADKIMYRVKKSKHKAAYTEDL